jgi:hypothetical protein
MATLVKKDGTQISVLVSNKTSKKYIKPVFNFDNLNDTHKEAVSEVISILNNRQGIPQHMIIEELKQNFQIEDIPEMDQSTSLWRQLTKDYPIGASIQGYRVEKDKDGKKYKVPHIAFSSDLDVLDDMMKNIITDVKHSLGKKQE